MKCGNHNEIRIYRYLFRESVVNLRRFAQKSARRVHPADGDLEFRETKRRKSAKSLYCKRFSVNPEFGHLFHMTMDRVACGCSGVGVSVENSPADGLRVLEVNTLEPLVKNVNATAQPYGARLSGRQGEVLREPR